MGRHGDRRHPPPARRTGSAREAPASPGGVAKDARSDRFSPEGSKLIAVLDSGGITALTPVNEKNRARLRALRQRAQDLTMPAAVLAEGHLSGHPGHDYHVRRLLDIVHISDLDEGLCLAAGDLRTQVARGGTARLPSGVDAIVVGFANERAANDDIVIVTSDRGDIEALSAYADNAERLSIRPS